MRLALNKEQWDKLCSHTDDISSFPVTVGNFLQHYTENTKHGNFNVAYNKTKKTYSVWYEDYFERFEDKELIDAMFNLFCHLEGI
jgi:hypothetical protein